MFKEIISLRPFFFSLREIENKERNKNILSLDLKLKIGWEYKLITKKYSHIHIKEQGESDNSLVLSLLTTELNNEGFTDLFNCANKIVNFNKEEEEKQKLYLENIKKLKNDFEKQQENLKKIFKNSSLDELKKLNDDDLFVDCLKNYQTKPIKEEINDGKEEEPK